MKNKMSIQEISKYNFLIAMAIVLFVGIFVLPKHVFADSVTVTESIDVYLTGPSLTYTITEGTASSISVTESTFTVVTDVHNSLIISSSIGGSIENNQNLPMTCFGLENRVTVPANTTVTFTPTGRIVCSTGGTAGAGGSGTGGSGPSSSSVTPSATSSSSEGYTFVDISTTGPKAISVGTKNDIEQIVKLMQAEETFIVPPDGKFDSNFKTTRFFAMQVALTVAGKDCESLITFTSCKDAAVAAGLVDADNLPSRFITRIEFYNMLLKAANIQVIKTSTTLEKYVALCTDLTKDDVGADVFATSRYYKIASIYEGYKCNIDKSFPKSAAMTFAARTLEAKKSLTK